MDGKGMGIQWTSEKNLENWELLMIWLCCLTPTKIMKVKTDSSQAVTLANGSIDEVQ